MKKNFLIILLGGLFFPLISFGASYNAYEAGGKTVIYDGLVPCGKGVCVYDSTNPKIIKDFLKFLEDFDVGLPDFSFEKNCRELGGKWQASSPCEFCDFFVMLNNIIQFLMTRIIPVVAVLMLVVGGVFFFFAGANPNALKTAKGILTSTIIGLIIIFAAFVIVGTILSAIGLADWTTQIYKNWWQDGFFQINCQ